jgi:hypothetical protein
MDVVTRVMEAGCICDLKISYYAGQVKLQPEDLGLDEDDLPEELYALGKRRLIPRDRVNRFKRIESKARRVLASTSWTFPATGCGRFVVATYINETNERLYEQKETFIEEMREFFQEYPKLRQERMVEWRDHLVGLSEKMTKLSVKKKEDFVNKGLQHLESLYPTCDGIARKFQFRWDWYSISFPSGESYSWANERANIRKEAMDKYRAYAESSVANFLESLVSELREEATKTVEIFADLLAEKRDASEVHHKQLRSMREFIDRFERMNFAGDVGVAKALERLRATLPEKVSELNDFNGGAGTLRGRIRKALGRVHEAATDAVKVPKIVASFLEFGRTVED